jgi:fumarate reductase flavoprotein subunit
MRANDYDVVVIGTGAAGLSAAALAAENGASVLMVEAAERTGGSSALSGGVFYAAGTSLQREAGIADDSTEAMYQYYMTLNQYKLEPALVRTLCKQSTQAFEWLRAIGVGFTIDNLYASGVDKVRRGPRASGHRYRA